VDADDGAIDGSGTRGHSLKFDEFIVNTSNPPIWNTGIDFLFDEQQLGFSPNAFGFVWTDGMHQSALSVLVEDAQNVRHSMVYYGPVMDQSYSGETSEDVFIGFTTASNVRIKEVSITNGVATLQFINQFEMDHIQYGVQVPEPRDREMVSIALIVTSGMLWSCGIKVRRRGESPYVSAPPPRFCSLQIEFRQIVRWFLNDLNHVTC
jgi:hypothetical protein